MTFSECKTPPGVCVWRLLAPRPSPRCALYLDLLQGGTPLNTDPRALAPSAYLLARGLAVPCYSGRAKGPHPGRQAPLQGSRESRPPGRFMGATRTLRGLQRRLRRSDEEPVGSPERIASRLSRTDNVPAAGHSRTLVPSSATVRLPPTGELSATQPRPRGGQPGLPIVA